MFLALWCCGFEISLRKLRIPLQVYNIRCIDKLNNAKRPFLVYIKEKKILQNSDFYRLTVREWRPGDLFLMDDGFWRSTSESFGPSVCD